MWNNYLNSYLDKLHLVTEDEEFVVPAIAEQEVAGVVTEKAAGLVDLAGVVAVVTTNLLISSLQINSNQMVGGLVSHVDFVVFFNQEPDIG